MARSPLLIALELTDLSWTSEHLSRLNRSKKVLDNPPYSRGFSVYVNGDIKSPGVEV
jgi:hypothetical protein